MNATTVLSKSGLTALDDMRTTLHCFRLSDKSLADLSSYKSG